MANPTPILRGTASQGKVQWALGDGAKFRMMLGRMEGQEIEITLKRRSRKRSLNQNSYYWGVVVGMIAEAAGYLPEEMHDALRFEFLRSHGDERLPSVRSTTELTTVEFEDYLSKCRVLASQTYGIYVPEPNEVEMTA